MLMLQRRDDPEFWQSVTGSVEEGETASQAAMREVKEEVAIDVASEQLTLIDCQRTVEFEIFHIYVIAMHRVWCATQNLVLPCAAARAADRFSEHLTYQWLDAPAAAALTKSWSNRQAIEEFVINIA